MGQIRHCSRVHQLRSVQGKGQWLWMPDTAQLPLHAGVHASHSLLLSGAHSSTSPPPHRRTPSASTPSSTRTTVNTLAQAAVEPPPVNAPTAEDPHHWSHLRQGTQHPHRPYRSSPTTQAPQRPLPQVFPPLRYPHLHQHWTSSHAQVAISTHQNIMNRKRESL